MATQQGAPSRPWFRLATMVRPPPPAAPPAPTPQPDQAPPPPPRPAAFMRPAFSQTFRAPPTVPPTQTTTTPPPVSPPPRPIATLPAANGVAPTSPPQPRSARASPPPPSPKVTSSSTSSTSPMQQSRSPSPVPTPHVSPPPPPPPPQPSYSPPPIPRSSTPTYSPPKSGKPLQKNSLPSPPNPINPVSHPPSPLALPSPQLKPEYEQKTMVVQETKEIPKNLDKGFNGDIRRHLGNWGTRNSKKPETSKKHSQSHSDSEDGGMRIITIAGENKGAIMELSPFGKKTHNFGDNPHRLHMKKDSPTASQLSDGEKSGSNSDGKSKAIKSKSQLMSAVMNSNVQGVNNSILYNCSTSHHDPGVHLSLSRKPMGFNSKLKDHIN
ncbi:hypothetical protein Lser_V15G36385 [Lactuca serriola]